MLCSACNDFLAGTSARTASPLKIRIHHPTLQSFQTSVAAGCHLCSLISTSDAFVPDLASADYDDRMKHSRIEWLFLDDELLFIERRYSPSGRPSSSLAPEAVFQLIESEKAETAAFAYKQTPNILSDSALSAARTWYGKCVEEHCDTCVEGSRRGKPFFPSRVVNVGSLGEPAVKVVSSNYSINEPYATLSHCWGHSQTLRLTRDNIERFEVGIALETLPKTFEQAVFVARKLGIRYLWIDSLCILQDCTDDWRAESAMMRNIYLHGALNLAASAASSDHDGLSFPRDPNRTRHIRVGVTWTQPDLVARKAPGEYHIFNGDIWDREVEAAPLNTRGWVLQERALAPRILHFGKSQLYWQCNAIFHSEMFPSDLKVKNLGPHVPRVTSNFTACLRRLREMAPVGGRAWKREREEAHARWSELVNAYSATALTRAEDKLIAVQALAETMLDVTGDTYVAGLWKSRIVEDVLWRTDVDDLPKGVAVRRPREWRAPTWSWASLDCKAEARSVYHYTGPLEWSGKSFVSEMAPSVEGFAGVSTGQLRSASLQVRGLLYRNRFAFAMRTLESPLSLYRPADESTPWSFKIVLDEWDEEAVRGPEYSVPAGTLFFTVGSPIAGTIEGLVLESVAGRGYQFRRTAYFEADISYGSTEDILKGSGVLENADKLDLLRDGEDVKGRLMYRFTLI